MIVRRVLIGTAAVLALFLLTFAIPIRLWRTGEQPRPPLEFAAPEPASTTPIWIDTDAACGHGARVDPDDCFALLMLIGTGLDIAGMSTTFGNAGIEVTHRTTRSLATQLGLPPDTVHRGAAGPLPAGPSAATMASASLASSLERAPLTIVALGPLTNIAQALHASPAARRGVRRLIAVMGRRTGHLFHPGEGSGAGMLFGHGPVFRDFNVSMDLEAVRRLVRMNLPLVLIPYAAAREVELGDADLDALAALGGTRAWVASRARGWLRYWREDIGRGGFYPFDATAAAFVREPSLFRCADVTAWVGDDPTMFIPFWNPPALLVTQDRSEIQEPQSVGSARYCLPSDPALGGKLRAWIEGGGEG